MTVSFNPRLRVGGDRQGIHNQRASKEVSIHASAWEATSIGEQTVLSQREFQSTPPRGRRRPADTRPVAYQEFQSTPPRGRRLG